MRNQLFFLLMSLAGISLSACHLANSVPPAMRASEAEETRAQEILGQAREAEDPAHAPVLYRAYLALRPRDFHAREDMADHLFGAGNYPLSLAEYLKILEITATDRPPPYEYGELDRMRHWGQIGHCYLQLNQGRKALVYFRKVYELTENAYSHYNLGRVYLQLRDYPRARHHLEHAKARGLNSELLREAYDKLPPHGY